MGRLSGNPMIDAWGRRFLKHLAAGIAASGSGDGRAVARRARKATRLLIEERAAGLVGKRARGIVGLCSFVLAGYRETLAEKGDPAASVAIVREAFARTYRTPMKLVVRLWLRFVRDPLEALARWPIARMGRKKYGSLMVFEQEVGDGYVDLIVTRCAYHRYFVEAGEPALTRIFCGWDRNWMDVIDASARPIHTERPTTISTGGDCCRFRFVRDEPGGAGPRLDIVTDG
jgi:hypothetical protein